MNWQKYDTWTKPSTPSLPRAISHNAIGHNPKNHKIWLVGGRDSYKQLVSYNYLNHSFTDYGSTFFPFEVYVEQNNAAQIGSILYLLRTSYSYEGIIHSFNMDTMATMTDVISPPLSLGKHSCIVSIRDEYIALLDGESSRRSTQIININTNIWLDSVPSFQQGRSQSSCAYTNDKMFVIGGWRDVYLSSIEFLSVSSASIANISSMFWSFTIDPLPKAISSTRAFAVNNEILVIGGTTATQGAINTVYVIDSITGTVSFGGYLSFAAYGASGIFVNNIAYSFGGTDGGNYWSAAWQMTAPLFALSTTTTHNDESTAQYNIISSSNVAVDGIFERKVDSVDGTKVTNNNEVTITPHDKRPFILTASVISLLIIIIIGAVIWCWSHRRKEKQILEHNESHMANNKADDDGVVNDDDNGDVKDDKSKSEVSVTMESLYDDNERIKTAGITTKTAMDVKDGVVNDVKGGKSKRQVSMSMESLYDNEGKYIVDETAGVTTKTAGTTTKTAMDGVAEGDGEGDREPTGIV